MFHLLSAPKLIKTRRGDPSNQWTCCKLGGGLYRCVCVSGSRHSDNSHGAMMRGERLQWHTAGILWHRSTPPGCLSLLFAAPLFHSVTTSSLPFPALQLSSILFLTAHAGPPSHSLSSCLMSRSQVSFRFTVCLLLSCPNSLLTSYSFSTIPPPSCFSACSFFSFLCFFSNSSPLPWLTEKVLCLPTTSPSRPPTHPIPSTPAMSVIPSLLLRGIRALQCTVWMPNESHAFYKPQPSPISVLPLSSSFLPSFLPLFYPSSTLHSFTDSLLLYLLARSHPAVYKE